jgi:zinc/manganese transport system substrate-binding protein
MLFTLLLAAAPLAQGPPVRIVAAENFYGNIAQQIGGDAVVVDSILTNPDRDPHQFEVSASTARKLSNAQIVIYNGIGYDAWVLKLLSASKSKHRDVIEVAALAGRKEGDNPHVWYDSVAVAALANALAQALMRMDPAQRDAYARRLGEVTQELNTLRARIEALRAKNGHTPVTATEPVFGYMADALGLDMRNSRFQLAVMNGTEPSASDIAAFEQDLRTRKAKVLIYNKQTSEGLTERLLKIARASGVPVVGVTETLPAGMTYQAWMHGQLDALEQALDRK